MRLAQQPTQLAPFKMPTTPTHHTHCGNRHTHTRTCCAPRTHTRTHGARRAPHISRAPRAFTPLTISTHPHTPHASHTHTSHTQCAHHAHTAQHTLCAHTQHVDHTRTWRGAMRATSSTHTTLSRVTRRAHARARRPPHARRNTRTNCARQHMRSDQQLVLSFP